MASGVAAFAATSALVVLCTHGRRMSKKKMSKRAKLDYALLAAKITSRRDRSARANRKKLHKSKRGSKSSSAFKETSLKLSRKQQAWLEEGKDLEA